MKKKINWWVLAAIVIICVPAGFVSAGLIIQKVEKTQDRTPKDDSTMAQNTVVSMNLRPESEDESSSKSLSDTCSAESTLANGIVDTDKKEEKKPVALSVEEAKQSSENRPTNSSKQDNKGLDKTENVENRRKETEEKIPAKTEPEPSARTDDEGKSSTETKPVSKKKEEAEINKETNESSSITPVENEAEKMRTEQDLTDIIKKGEQHDDIPELLSNGCDVLLNGETMAYQDYRIGIRSRAYTNPDVKSIQRNSKGKVIKIVVSADINK